MIQNRFKINLNFFFFNLNRFFWYSGKIRQSGTIPVKSIKNPIRMDFFPFFPFKSIFIHCIPTRDFILSNFQSKFPPFHSMLQSNMGREALVVYFIGFLVNVEWLRRISLCFQICQFECIFSQKFSVCSKTNQVLATPDCWPVFDYTNASCKIM